MEKSAKASGNRAPCASRALRKGAGGGATPCSCLATERFRKIFNSCLDA